MSQELKCNGCGKHMATLRDARVRNGMVVYCRECDAINKRDPQTPSVPDFMRSLFK